MGAGTQYDTGARLVGACFDLTAAVALGDLGQHFCVELGRFGTEVTVIRCQRTEIFCDFLHHVEGIVESFESAGKSPVRNSQNLVVINHQMLVLCI